MKSKKVQGKGINMRIILGIIMLIASIVFGLFIIPKLGSNPDTSYTVYELTKDIPAGTALTESDIKESATIDKTVAALTVGDAQAIIGKIAAVDLKKNMYVYTSDLSTGQILSKNFVPQGKQILSIPITSLAMSVSYQLQTDDVVRVFTVTNGVANVPRELQYVQVYNVYDENGNNPHISGLHPQTISFIVNQTQAEKLVSLTSTSSIQLSLIARNDEKLMKDMLSAQETVLEQIKANPQTPSAGNQ